MAPESSPRFWRHVSISEIWLALTLWAWGPGLWVISWTERQAPHYAWLQMPIFTALVLGTLGSPFALGGVAIRLSRHFAMPVILRLAVHGLIAVIAYQTPAPLSPAEQEWQANRATLQALANQALASKDGAAAKGPWKARVHKGQVTLTMQGYGPYSLAYTPTHTLDLDQYINVSGPTTSLDKQLDQDWYLLRIETTL